MKETFDPRQFFTDPRDGVKDKELETIFGPQEDWGVRQSDSVVNEATKHEFFFGEQITQSRPLQFVKKHPYLTTTAVAGFVLGLGHLTGWIDLASWVPSSAFETDTSYILSEDDKNKEKVLVEESKDHAEKEPVVAQYSSWSWTSPSTWFGGAGIQSSLHEKEGYCSEHTRELPQSFDRVIMSDNNNEDKLHCQHVHGLDHVESWECTSNEDKADCQQYYNLHKRIV